MLNYKTYYQIDYQKEIRYLKNISDTSSLIQNWTVDLRYGASIKQKNNASEDDECKNSLKDCLDFLRNFLKVRDEFKITIAGKSIDIERNLTGGNTEIKESPETKQSLEKTTSNYNYLNKELSLKSNSYFDNEEMEIE